MPVYQEKVFFNLAKNYFAEELNKTSPCTVSIEMPYTRLPDFYLPGYRIAEYRTNILMSAFISCTGILAPYLKVVILVPPLNTFKKVQCTCCQIIHTHTLFYPISAQKEKRKMP